MKEQIMDLMFAANETYWDNKDTGTINEITKKETSVLKDIYGKLADDIINLVKNPK